MFDFASNFFGAPRKRAPITIPAARENGSVRELRHTLEDGKPEKRWMPAFAGKAMKGLGRRRACAEFS
jgi:hypothetical protein